MREFLFLTLLILLFASCGTHAPMSEMVMFNQKKTDEAEYGSFGHAVALANVPFKESDFREVTSGDYLKPTKPSAYSYNLIFLREDRLGVSTAIGSGFGADLTYNVHGSNYLTLAYSIPQSIRLIAQRSLVNSQKMGVAAGLYAGNYSSSYYDFCGESSCGYRFGPDGAGMIFCGWGEKPFSYT